MKNLKKYREEKNLSQQALAEMIGMSRFSIIDYESGRKSPTVEVAKKISAVLGCSIYELEGENPTATPPRRRRDGKPTEAA